MRDVSLLRLDVVHVDDGRRFPIPFDSTEIPRILYRKIEFFFFYLFIYLFFFYKAVPYAAIGLHFLEPFFVFFRGDMALCRKKTTKRKMLATFF